MGTYKDLALSAVRASGLAVDGQTGAVTITTTEVKITQDLKTALEAGNTHDWNVAVTAWKAAHNGEDNHFPVIKDAVVEGKTLNSFKFEQVVLDNCMFHNCTLNDNTFTHSKLQNDTQFVDSNINRTTFIKCVMDGACNPGENPGATPEKGGEAYKTAIISGGQMTGSKIQESVVSNVKIDTTFNVDDKGNGNAIYYNADLFCTDITNRAAAADKAPHSLEKGGLQVNHNQNVHNTHVNVIEGGKTSVLSMTAPELQNRMMGEDCPGLTPDLNKVMMYPVADPKQEAIDARNDHKSMRAMQAYENLQNVEVAKFGTGSGGLKDGFTAGVQVPFRYRESGSDFSMMHAGWDVEQYPGQARTNIMGTKLGYSFTAGNSINDTPTLLYNVNASMNAVNVDSGEVSKGVPAPGLGASVTGYRGHVGLTAGVNGYYMNTTKVEKEQHLTLNAKPMIIPSIMVAYDLASSNNIFGHVNLFAQVSKLISNTTIVDDNAGISSSPGNGSPRISAGIRVNMPVHR